MYCRRCGAEIEEGAQVCAYCGEPVAQESAQREMPMKWYKFLIYFSLFAGAVLNVINGISVLTGLQYDTQEEGLAALVYETFPGLKGVDVFFSLGVIALGVFGLFVRFQLSGFKKNAPVLLTFLYVFTAIINVGYAALASSMTGLELFDSYLVGNIIGQILMAVVNYVYFKKRAHLFIN